MLEPHFNGLNYWTTYYNERERNIVFWHFPNMSSTLHVEEVLPVVHQPGGHGSWSTHLLHVGRQQRPGGQEHFLFVHHFSLTWSIVEGTWKKVAKGRSGPLLCTGGILVWHGSPYWQRWGPCTGRQHAAAASRSLFMNTDIRVNVSSEAGHTCSVTAGG